MSARREPWFLSGRGLQVQDPNSSAGRVVAAAIAFDRKLAVSVMAVPFRDFATPYPGLMSALVASTALAATTKSRALARGRCRAAS